MKYILIVIFSSFISLTLQAQSDSVPINLDKVLVTPKDNPAHRIINNAVANRDRNAAFFCESFQYYSYQKLWITPKDSCDTTFKYYLFLTENVTKISYQKPDKQNEKIIASKTSGLKNPLFNMAFRRLQFNNFYQSDYLELFEIKYVSPISRTATRQYYFEMSDTLYDGNDTIFVIHFQPKPKSVFKSLKGILYIHSENYAVQRIEAEPFLQNEMFKISVNQEYKKEGNGTWFPYRFSAVMPFPRTNPSIDSLNLLCLSTISIKDIKINLPLKKSEFGLYDFEEQIESEKSGNTFLNTYRDNSLTKKELSTYKLIDSVGKAAKIDKSINVLSSLLLGMIPIGPIDLDLFSVVNYTHYEGWRFGLGLYTNNKLSKRIHFGGYLAYGLKDKAWKWGGMAEWLIYRPRNLSLKVNVSHDIVESGETNLISKEETGLLNGEFYRHWIINKFDDSKKISAKMQMQVTKWLTASITGIYSQNKTLYDYQFTSFVTNNTSFLAYNNFVLRGGIRIAFKEFTYKTADLTLYQPSPYPTLQLIYERGMKGVFESDFNYNKINARIHYRPHYKKLGYSYLTINFGIIDVPVPYSLQFVSPGGYEQLGFDGKEQFATMRPNEFLSSANIFVFLRHNFGKMTHGKRFSPQIELCQNIGFGWLRQPEVHQNITFNTMNKGYFEAGLLIHNLISYKDFLAMGVGVFYRYGAYAFANEQDNFSFKVSLTVPLYE